MKTQHVRGVASISILLLLLTSIPVITSSTSFANAEEQTSVNSATSSSGSDEVSAASGSNRFVVWQDSPWKGTSDIFFRRSPDNGVTWHATKNLSNNPGSSMIPEITVSGSNVYVVWLQSNADDTQRDILFRRSTDNGATWKPIVKIVVKITTSTGGVDYAEPKVISSGTHVYVVWGQSSQGEIYIRRSSDNGATWKTIFNLSSNPGKSLAEQIEVSGSNVYVVWSQRNADETKADVFFRRSTDNGATWKSKVNLSNSGQAFAFPHMAVTGSYIHVVWNEVFIRSSADSGATWKSAKTLTSTDGFFDPLVDTSGPNVYVLYDEIVGDTGKSSLVDIMIQVSRDNGATWGPAVTIGEEVDTLARTEPRLLALGSNVYVVWVSGGFGYGDLYFRRSTDYGATWGPVSGDLNHRDPGINSVQIAASGSSVYLVWANHGGVYEIFFLRSINSGATWQPVKNLSENTSISGNPQIAA